MKMIRRLYIACLFVFLGQLSFSQMPYVGGDLESIESTLRFHCLNSSKNNDLKNGSDSTRYVMRKGDKLLYRVSHAEEIELAYVFSDSICTELHASLSCLVCLKTSHRKSLFPGKWRVDEGGLMYNAKRNLKASIRKVENCPYLFRVSVTYIENKIDINYYRNMVKVKKRRIGTFDYMTSER